MANKRRFQLSDKQANELLGAYAQTKDGPTRTRCQAVRLYGLGYPTQEVLKITNCSRASLMEWCRAYRRHGVAGLEDKRRGGNNAKLTPAQVEGLSERLHRYTPRELFGVSAATGDGQFWSVPDLQRAIEEWYGVTYTSQSSYCRLFARCGFSYQRPAKVYKSRRENQVAEFEEMLEKKRLTSPKTRPRR